MNKLLFVLGFTILIFIVVNRILCNEKYQEVIDVGYYYHFFCARVEQKLFNKSMSSIISTIDKDKRILDFGCGPGIMSVFFNNNYVGVDIDKTRIQYAQKMYPEKTFKQIGFLSNDERNTVIPYPNNYFDIILLNDCVHHISNREMSDIISELFRVLQVGGYIIVREPNKNTNMLTYMVTEIAENGNYIRSKEEYKQLFNPLELVHEKSSNEIIRDYYIFIVKKNSNIYYGTTWIENRFNITREVLNCVTSGLLVLSIYVIFYSILN
jgi:ubiquinone/menaquinone biosynthesis C-methylase UbiE